MKKITLFFLLFITLSGIAQDGQLDLSFTPPSDFDNSIEVIAQQTDGKILIGGDFEPFQYLKRLNIDGSLDISFNAPAIFYASMRSIVIQPDGKILAGGVGPNDLVRLNTDGSMDSSFNAGEGIPFGGISNIVLQDDGKIIIGGDFDEFSGTIISGMVRLNMDGSIDTSFDLGLLPGTNVRDFDVQSDGKIIIGGADATGFILKRFGNDNMEDLSFNSGGLGTDDEIYGVDVVENDKIMITGPFNTYNDIPRHQIARLSNDGNLDTSFDSYNSSENGSYYTIFDTKQITNGQYLVNGYFHFYNDQPSRYIAKINPDGTIDETFNMGDGANTYISSTCIQDDGNILIGGDFTSFNGTAINNIARLNNEILSVDIQEKEDQINVYPNPFKDNLALEFGNLSLIQSPVSIYNMTGQLVHSSFLSDTKSINLSSLKSGIYLLKITSAQQIFNTKIVKQ